MPKYKQYFSDHKKTPQYLEVENAKQMEYVMMLKEDECFYTMTCQSFGRLEM